MLAAALCRTKGCILVRFVGRGRNERTLNGKRHPKDIRREQELQNFLIYYHSCMRPPLIFTAHRVFGALESVNSIWLLTQQFIQTSEQVAIERNDWYDFYAGNAAILWSNIAVLH